MTKRKLIVILLIAGLSGGIILGLFTSRLWKRGLHPGLGPNHFLANYLSLSDSQRKEVESLNESFYTKISKIRNQLAQEKAQLYDLLGESPPNQEKMEVKIDEIASLQVQLEREVINHLVEMGKILTPIQRAKFFSFTRRRLSPGKQNQRKWERKFTPNNPLSLVLKMVAATFRLRISAG